MRVLIVDERSLADTLVMILQREGHEAASAYNGAAALQKIECFIPDCVISDVIMPGLNGIELCAIIERKHHYCHIPLFSGQPSTNELVEKARPVDPDEPLDKLTSLHAGSR